MKKKNTKTKKNTKKNTKIAKQKTIRTDFLSHFHVGTKLALTVWSKQVPDKDICCLGMALAHNNDMSSRKIGRETAFTRCLKGLTDFDKNQKALINTPAKATPSFWDSIVNLFRGEPPAQESRDIMAELDENLIVGKSGCWLVKGADNAKRIIQRLRCFELWSSDGTYLNTTRDAYYQAFFRLSDLSEMLKNIIHP